MCPQDSKESCREEEVEREDMHMTQSVVSA